MLRLALFIMAALPLGAADIVPFKLVEKIPVVIVYLNRSGPYRMIVDTGSSTSLLDQRIARKLDIPQIRRTTMVTLLGETVMPVGNVSALSVGTANFNDVEVMFLTGAQMPRDQIDADGVIGQNVLSRTDYLLDYQHRKIQFDFLEGDIATGHSIRCVLEKSRCLVAGTVPGRGTRDLVLDSGASFPVLPADLMVNDVRRMLGDVALITHSGSLGLQSSSVDLMVVDGHLLRPGQVLVAPFGHPRLSGVLPTHLFHSIFFHNKTGEVILNPKVE